MLNGRARETNNGSQAGAYGHEREWVVVDRKLRSLASRQAALDAEGAACLREAERLQIWRHVGCVSMLAYLEEICGYGPHTAHDRLRVARLLGDLPAMSSALSAGVLTHSAVRELVRVATASTEAAWIEAARGKVGRQIEKLIAGHKQGDLPEDPKGPDLRERVIRLELSPQVFALYLETCKVLCDERGAHLNDDAIIETLCRAVLTSSGEASAADGPAHQVAVTICEECKRGWQEGGGRAVEISAAAAELACCDAKFIGSVDAERPQRATSDITPAVRRLVKQRDHGGCVVPGCRSRRNLDLHHIEPRANGGKHDPSNVCLVCSGHHRLLHAGLLTITGTAPDKLVFTRTSIASASPSEFAVVARATAEARVASPDRQSASSAHVGRDATEARDRDARAALTGCGFSATIATRAVAAAAAHVGRVATLEAVLREALRRTHEVT